MIRKNVDLQLTVMKNFGFSVAIPINPTMPIIPTKIPSTIKPAGMVTLNKDWKAFSKKLENAFSDAITKSCLSKTAPIRINKPPHNCQSKSINVVKLKTYNKKAIYEYVELLGGSYAILSALFSNKSVLHLKRMISIIVSLHSKRIEIFRINGNTKILHRTCANVSKTTNNSGKTN
jgi:hypothetical protein